MMLQQLIKNIPVEEVAGALGRKNIRGVTQDSRQVKKGFLFVAVPGHEQDGHRFIPDAVRNGAAAVVISQAPQAFLKIPQIQVEDSRKVLADLAARFYGEPSLKMRVIGITGTNGKTSVTFLLESILKAAGRKPAVLGTINYRFGRKTFPAPHTTPESVDLQKFFAQMKKVGATDILMEVSSHALALGRVRGVHFDAVAFTNLTQDHLDFHADLDDYFQAKKRLFDTYLAESRKKTKIGVVNAQDPRSDDIARDTQAKVVRVGLTGPYDVACRLYELSEEGLRAEVVFGRGGKSAVVTSRLMGLHNLENILVAAGVAHGLGIPVEAIVRGIRALKAVPGRLERIDNKKGLHVFVDYAHTPDAIARVGEALKKFVRKGARLITVFGCGGDRDRTKRPLMGREAGLVSDFVVVTSDNPRTEDPESIIAEILPGLKDAGVSDDRVVRIVSREAALKKAVQMARPGDFLIVAGKGHEDYQIIGKTKTHFSDQEILRKYLGGKK